MFEQVCIAALDCSRIKLAEQCIKELYNEFPSSVRVQKLYVMKLEALERYDDALKILETLIKRDMTNGALQKRKIAIYKAMGKIPEAIEELVSYLKM